MLHVFFNTTDTGKHYMPHKKVIQQYSLCRREMPKVCTHIAYSLQLNRNFVSIKMLCTSVYIEYVNLRHTVCMKVYQQELIVNSMVQSTYVMASKELTWSDGHSPLVCTRVGRAHSRVALLPIRLTIPNLLGTRLTTTLQCHINSLCGLLIVTYCWWAVTSPCLLCSICWWFVSGIAHNHLSFWTPIFWHMT